MLYAWKTEVEDIGWYFDLKILWSPLSRNQRTSIILPYLTNFDAIPKTGDGRREDRESLESNPHLDVKELCQPS